ncbi:MULTISPECIES: hypothetical protein [unclassified Bosea (in: a-proteobacteria)]|uniref:hypothetical protein n=1 Tax=unclassified Bosea (in: a-proteobacteria) TaxID=2653178 RepID=UPI000F75DA48|nr:MULTISPECIES: hypothetical protein [unclassified Bosea (in: a-proteobacteria)]AZO77473.1 hypothetical protein BLM15_07505 [Bosea sp. Tri-49]RXT18078.1 hypothetical protein B5U98_22655 [Bosea sp. Tri-39]RXT32676.1 hypothetical protein B5U99_29000 [Bosea sp. Tri-54]
MIAAWPSQVPFRSPVNGIVAGQSYSAPRQSQTEDGPAILRPQPGPRATELPWRSPLLSLAEWEAFEQFARRTLRQGTLPFKMPVWRPNGYYVDRVCQIKDGAFSTDFSVASRVVVSFTLIVWNW